MTILPILFCPNCETYIGPVTPTCFCGWQRPEDDRLPQAGKALWQTHVGGPARGQALLADNKVLFGWGKRQVKGGITAINCLTGVQSWQTESTHSVEGGPVVSEGRVIFGTLGLLQAGAEVRCHRLDDGMELWRAPVTDNVWSKPVIQESRVFVGSSDGHIHCFDLNNGKPVAGWPMVVSRGRMWLAIAEDSLIAISESGLVASLDPLHCYHRWPQPINLGSEVNAGPAVKNGHVLIGTVSGQIFSIQTRSGKLHRIGDDHYGRIVAAPFINDDVLYFGSRDHYLHALSTGSGQEIWKYDCKHTIASSPTFGGGLIFIGGNDGGVYALDAKDGVLAWRFPVQRETPVIGSPTYEGGIVYIGTENGDAYALPWHFGNYSWAATWLSMREHYAEAASCYAISSELELRDANRKQVLGENAIQNWKSAGEPVLAVRFRESILGQKPESIALDYESIGISLPTHESIQKAKLLHRASELYEEADDQKGSERCLRMAMKLTHAPYLNVRVVNLPPNWEAYKVCQVVFELKNLGNQPAQEIRVRVAGNLVVRLWIDLDSPLEPDKHAEITASVVPTGPGELVIEWQFSEPSGMLWSSKRRFPFDVVPSNTILHIHGDLGAGILSDELLKTLQGKIEVDGDVGLLKAKAAPSETSLGQSCPKCHQLNPLDNRFCVYCGALLAAFTWNSGV